MTKLSVYPSFSRIVRPKIFLFGFRLIAASMDGDSGVKIFGPHFDSIFTEPFKELVKTK